MINIKDSLVLDDDNEYVVVSKVNYETKEYFYILDKFNNSNYKFCYLDNEELVEIEDEELTKILLPLLLDSAKEEIENLV
jgi:hypothetical protein